MKKYKYIFFILLLFAFASCEEANLNKMANELRQHIIKNDESKGIKTKIEKIKPISYIELKEGANKEANDKYLCKIFLKAAWWYEGGLRVYNICDTLDCYYDKDMKFIRSGKKE